ncbi:hypothetical protein [Geodermatophilus sp. SYSU D00815]
MTTAQTLLVSADRLLREVVPGSRGLWPRTVAFLLRSVLEREIDDYWRRHSPGVERAPMRAQLVVLGRREYAGPAVGRAAGNAWDLLSAACHHHAYELAPTAEELRSWLTQVAHVRAALQRAPGTA